jgi:hypothetical protein
MKREHMPVIVAKLAFAAVVICLAVYKKYLDMNEFESLEGAVAAQLKDPASATFRDEHQGPRGALCGQFTAKDGNGGGTGYEDFVVVPNVKVVTESLGTVFLASTSASKDLQDRQAAVTASLRWSGGAASVRAYNKQQVTQAWVENCQ